MSTGHGIQSLIPPKKNILPKEETDNNLSSLRMKEEKKDEYFPPMRILRDEERVEEKPRTEKEPRLDVRHESVFHIEVDKIKPNPYQPRKTFDREQLEELSQSIREFGIIQPLVVSKAVKEKDTGAEVEYQLIAGERRLLAAKMAGLERVPAVVKKVDFGKAKLELALIENVQRSDLNALDSAKAYARLQDEFGLTQKEIAVRIGKSREVVANTIRLLNLPSHMQTALAEGKMNESQARAILSVSDPGEQQRLFEAFVLGKISAKQAREKNLERNDARNPEEVFLLRKLEEKLGAPVRFFKGKKGGKIVIQFYSDDEWKSILDTLLNESED